MLDDTPPELTRNGLVKGSLFEDMKIAVRVVNGKRVLRVEVFSGVDPSALLQDSIASIEQLLPQFSVKFSSGFSLGDLLSSKELKEMLQFKCQVQCSWHVKLAEIATQTLASMSKMDNPDQIPLLIGDIPHPVLIGICKFFQAQKSLMVFNFASPMELISSLVKDELMELLFGEGSPGAEMIEAEVIAEAPSAELVDSVVDAATKISGKTFSSLRSRFMEECFVPAALDSEDYLALPMDAVRLMLKELESHAAERYSEDPHSKETKELTSALKLVRLYFKAQAALTGFNGAQVVSSVYEAGVRVRGLGDVFNLTPTFDEFSARKAEPICMESEYYESYSDRPYPGPQWVKQYVESLKPYLDQETEDQPYRPKLAYLEGLRDDFSELLAVLKAAWPYLSSVDTYKLLHAPSAAAAKTAEDEAQLMFGFIEPQEGAFGRVKLSPEQEMAKKSEELFRRIDTDADGILTQEELRATFGDHADECLSELDTNQDGSISLQEWVDGLYRMAKGDQETFEATYTHISRQIDER